MLNYNCDKLIAGNTMRIEHTIFFQSDNLNISHLTALTLKQLQAMREESAAAEQAIFSTLQEQAVAWEEQAAKTLLLDKAIEFAETTVSHTANKWEQLEENRMVRSNMVYQMLYYLFKKTRYDETSQTSIPYAWNLTWWIYTNGPDKNSQVKIAGQDRKVFADKAAMEKYLNGRIKAYNYLFTEISPPIPQKYAPLFRVNGQLLPGYTIEGASEKTDLEAEIGTE